jgi:PfaD family protein
VAQIARDIVLVEQEGAVAAGSGGTLCLGGGAPAGALPLLAHAPALTPDRLGDPAFRAAHGVRYPYVLGAMANGIASVDLVQAAARAGLLAFFGSAGLHPREVEEAVERLQGAVGDLPHGFNLIHSPADPQLEDALVDLYLRRGVRRVSASAYLTLTLPLVRYRFEGIHRDAAGNVVAPNRLVAKLSRIEVARLFLSPPPDEMLQQLVAAGTLTAEQAAMAATLPLAEDITAEADSGGHTDNRPALALIPTMRALRDQVQAERGYPVPPRIGAAGGLGTPDAVAAAFGMGAAYVLTGSVNQSAREAGTSDAVKRMLAEAEQADVIMAPSADMFEMGVKVQVLKRGTMFPLRARKLYELYREYGALEEIPAAVRDSLEKQYLRSSFEDAWAGTCRFFEERDPRQIERGSRDPKHRMALVFRSYLGRTSDWAKRGDETRKMDYQIWCGPAMGAFNQWARGTFLESPERRDVVTIGMNLLVGAAVLIRARHLRTQHDLPPACERFAPREPAELAALLQPGVQV